MHDINDLNINDSDIDNYTSEDPLNKLFNTGASSSNTGATFCNGRYRRVHTNIGEGAYGKVHKCEDLECVGAEGISIFFFNNKIIIYTV